MTDWLRRAGRGRAADGSLVTWSAAEGRRGRRWREVLRTADGSVLSSLLLEAGSDGRFSHTELATAAGLLTLHPEGDGTLHGNVITPAGIEHVRGVPWADDSIVLVEGSPAAMAVATRTLAGRIAPGERAEVGAFVVGRDLRWAASPCAVERVDAQSWRFAGGGEVVVDARGIPDLADSAEWPLEE